VTGTKRIDALELYLTAPGPCPYLAGRVERKVLTVLDADTAAIAPLLNARGFRRTQQMFYRQECPGCRACIATRLKLKDFKPGRSFRRILKRNADLVTSIEKPEGNDENYALFSRYLKARHGGGGMENMGYADYAGMMEDSPIDTRFLTARKNGALLAVMLFDDLPDGSSAVYSFYAPEEEARSLGSWLILQLAAYTKDSGRPYLYLGFWVKGSPKMDYKARFQPLEIFVNEAWVDFALPVGSGE
jgi:arginine-tRNA-protein transferase